MSGISLWTPMAVYWGIGLVIVFQFLQRLRNWRRLRHIPGPWHAGLSTFWLLKHTLGGRFVLDARDLSLKYQSDLIRIGPRELLTSDPDELRRILGVRTKYSRGDWFDCLQFELGHYNLLSQRDNEKHRVLRSKLAAGYSGKDCDGMEEVINENIANFIKLIESKYLSTPENYKPVDFAEKSSYFTIDTITDLAFGKRLGDLTEDRDCHGFIEFTDRSLKMFGLVGVLPRLNWILKSPIMKPFLPTDKDLAGLGKIMGLAKGAVAERFGPNKIVRKDMLGSFVAHGGTQRELDYETMVQLIAGADTSVGAIRAIFLFVLTNPMVYNKLIQELSTSDISSPIKDSEARKLPYLQAVIKEALRMQPPAVAPAFREVPKGGDTICGYFVPGGALVGYNFYKFLRSPKYFGADANIFRPERWLDEAPEKLKEMEKNVELVFGHGKWKCLGRDVAAMELNKVVPELFRNFEFTIVNPQQPWKCFTGPVHLITDMFVRIMKREPSY